MSASVAVALSGFVTSPTVHSALVVGGFVAAVTGVVGVFTVVRGQSFAGHALADLGAVGGAGAFLVGISQLWGFVGAGVVAALLMEAIGTHRLKGRDVATGVVFAFGLGLTALFLYWDTTIGGSSNAAVSVLFGSLFVIDASVVPPVALLSVVVLLLVGTVYRWLLLASVDEDLAVARGVPVRLAGLVFLVALALATALLIGPAATALLLTRRFGVAVLLAAGIGVLETWVGCLIAYESYYWAGKDGNWPVSFCVVALVLVGYIGARLASRIVRGRTASRPAMHAPRILADVGRVG
jgi:zinc/manganese transport system permease protein